MKDSVGAIAQTDFLRDFRGVDVINRDVVLGEIALHIVRQVGGQFITLPDGVQQESAVVAQTTEHVIHVEVSLNVASHEVRRLDLIGRTDRVIAETQV